MTAAKPRLYEAEQTAATCRVRGCGEFATVHAFAARRRQGGAVHATMRVLCRKHGEAYAAKHGVSIESDKPR